MQDAMTRLTGLGRPEPMRIIRAKPVDEVDRIEVGPTRRARRVILVSCLAGIPAVAGVLLLVVGGDLGFTLWFAPVFIASVLRRELYSAELTREGVATIGLFGTGRQVPWDLVRRVEVRRGDLRGEPQMSLHLPGLRPPLKVSGPDLVAVGGSPAAFVQRMTAATSVTVLDFR